MITKYSLLKQRFHSFEELEKEISKLPDSYDRGYAFEDFAKAFMVLQKSRYQVKDFYLRKDIPDEIAKLLKLEETDHGVDGVIVRLDDSLIAVQIKFRCGNTPLTYTELSTFWTEADHADGCLTFTNSVNIPKEAANRRVPQQSVTLNELVDLDDSFFEQMYDYFNQKEISERKSFTREEHQKKIIKETLEKIDNHDRGKIIAACGTGKTVISKWLHDDLNSKATIFFAPSLALIKQTIDSWTTNTDSPFMYMAVCSDETVINNDENDTIDYHTHEMSFPVSTSPDDIGGFLKNDSDLPKVIFCTYQSADAIANALQTNEFLGDFEFSLGLYDEAHRTAGGKNSSMFTVALDDNSIRVKKRIFLTATERVASPSLIKAYEDAGETIYSMDNIQQYGPTFSSYNFGQAIKDGIIANYQMVVCSVSEDDIAELLQTQRKAIKIDASGEEHEVTVEQLLLQVILAKAFVELPIHKVVAYLNRVSTAKKFIADPTSGISLSDVFSQVAPSIPEHNLYINSVDGTMPAKVRKKILDEFANAPFGVISNAKCLTEGVDVPAIDAVFFANPKTSTVDIIQAIGRALRKSKEEEKTAFIILPVIVPSGVDTFDGINAEAFETIHNVISALADQDANLKETIEQINYANGRGGYFGSSQKPKLPIQYIPIGKVNIPNFKEALEFRIGDVNSRTAEEKVLLKSLTSGKRSSNMSRSFTSISDYKYEAMFNSLIYPTLQIFKDKNATILPSKDIKINNNNVSHTYRLGAIEKAQNRQYTITDLGYKLMNNFVSSHELFKTQMLRYYIIDKETNGIIFPYRAWLKVLLEVPKIRKLDFIYALYTLHDTSAESLRNAIYTVQYLQETYPYEDKLSVKNKEDVLNLLNKRFNTTLGFMDVWTSRGTSYNQYNYFIKHLLCFDNFIYFNKDNSTVEIIQSERAAVRELLSHHEYLEKFAAEQDITNLRKEYTKL